ncbi:DMT family transporter [Patescibacteria group bacterium]|nr:DMT family transporter [Patescibacteria group bacterium]MBU1952473.1 DMT family transporter [Patescibacteria group bacterium]
MIRYLKELPTIQKGILLAFGTALVSGVANFINKGGVTAVGEPFVYTAMKNVITAVLLLGVLFAFKNIKQLKNLKKLDWMKLTVIGLIGGSIPFLLFFKGLSITSASSASFIHKTLFIWVALLAVAFLKERFRWYQYGALVILFLGNFIILGPKAFSWGAGESLVFIATLLWSAEFIVAKKVLKTIHPNIVAWARLTIGSAFILSFLMFTGRFGALLSAPFAGWGWSILTGAILLLFVLTWYHALKRAPATLITSILVFASPITTFLNEVFRKQELAWNSAVGSLLIIVGIAIFSLAMLKTKKELLSDSSKV